MTNMEKSHNKRTCYKNLPFKTKIKNRKPEQTIETSEAGPSTRTRRAKPAKVVQKGKWKRKDTNAAGSSIVPPSDSAAPSSTFAYSASIEALTGNYYVLRKQPVVLGVSDLSKEL
ncbi:unnamed protein product [Prunus armeniaca]|uniref:Uncharacterized protein n=1 Tax=Prunus armeniaca TaxID=36596 RepID=A0A6J5Y126_PRUAR|nr:unnamed protein product [Prunus armeniaca]CAB4317635.1 unnamed protein product [Prunus armeniaca]